MICKFALRAWITPGMQSEFKQSDLGYTITLPTDLRDLIPARYCLCKTYYVKARNQIILVTRL